MKIINESTFFGDAGQRSEVFIYDGKDGLKYQVVTLLHDIRFNEEWFLDIESAKDFAEDFVLKTPIAQ
jgi:hypothetical protein